MSSDSLKTNIQTAMKEAMRAQDKERLNAIRLMWSTIRQQEIDSRNALDDTQVLAVLDKMVKQRRDSINQYESAGRAELAAKETAEIAVIQTFMPEPLSDSEVEQLIKKAITQTGAESMKDMGKVMGIIKPQIQGRADAGAVSHKVKELLG